MDSLVGQPCDLTDDVVAFIERAAEGGLIQEQGARPAAATADRAPQYREQPRVPLAHGPLSPRGGVQQPCGISQAENVQDNSSTAPTCSHPRPRRPAGKVAERGFPPFTRCWTPKLEARANANARGCPSASGANSAAARCSRYKHTFKRATRGARGRHAGTSVFDPNCANSCTSGSPGGPGGRSLRRRKRARRRRHDHGPAVLGLRPSRQADRGERTAGPSHRRAPTRYCGDSMDTLPAPAADFIMSCPPYGDDRSA